eukprot:COSAG01_NODE_60978_length_291_cov_9.114583_1_plen_93_part_01
MQVECMAGVHTTFLFELRDEWGNTRITDDAIVNVDPDKRTSIPYDPPSWTVEYIGAGQYRVSLQMKEENERERENNRRLGGELLVELFSGAD